MTSFNATRFRYLRFCSRAAVIAVLLIYGLTVPVRADPVKMPPTTSVRHDHSMTQGIPAEYRYRRNPLRPSVPTLTQGREFYGEHCLMCHGPFGLGDGEMVADLEMRPPSLLYLQARGVTADDYAYWAIAEGGEALGTPMPAFKEALDEAAIWSLITYLKAGLPDS